MIATVVSGIVGYAAIAFLLRFLRTHALYLFVGYRLALAALLLAPVVGAPPREVAERLGRELQRLLADGVGRVEVAGPGFLNLFLSDDWFRAALAAVLEAGDGFGSGGAAPVEHVDVEFVSANPTGPLTVANARGAALGDSLCRILGFAGHGVARTSHL